MKVSEIAEKYGLPTATVVDEMKELGFKAPKVGDNLSAPDQERIEAALAEKGHKTAQQRVRVTLIKKSKQAEPSAEEEAPKAEPAPQAVIKVKKKIMIKRKAVPAAPPATGTAAAAPASIAASPTVTRDSGGGRPGASGGAGSAAGGGDKRPPQRGRGRGPQHRDRYDSFQRKERDFKVKRKERREHSLESVPKQIDILDGITVGDLARKMNLKANEVIAKLLAMGEIVTINQQIDSDTATLVAGEFGCEARTISMYDETVVEEIKDTPEQLKLRPPIVTVMGHVDHGKTKLLDAIRSADVVSTEHGGITQHIGAYQVSTGHGEVTFLDTPGHEAFTMMRARGASVTDVVILVVAADDGIMPQTVEAINHAKAAAVPIIVAINKIDKPEANIDRVKQQIGEHGLVPEEWGGTTMCIPVSALQKTGIKELLDAVLLQAEVLELKANPDKAAVGTVLDARVDTGKGNVATVLCQAGTIRVGDFFVAGTQYGKVRAMLNDRGDRVEAAPPAMPVEILGFNGLPQAGDHFHITEERIAKQIASKRHEVQRFEDMKKIKRVTMDTLNEQIQAGEMKELKVVIKADVQGSAEALRDSLEKIRNDEVRLVCIHHSAGAINEGDVMLSAASNALLIGFHVRPNNRARELAEREKVEIKIYNIIYDVINDIEAAITGMMAPELKEQITGSAEVREVFKVPKVGAIAGCYVIEGTIHRATGIRVIRDGNVLHDGKISSLKRFKDDAREVAKGYECGIGIDGFHDIEVGDTLENYSIKEIRPGKA